MRQAQAVIVDLSWALIVPSMTLLGKFICGRLRKQKSSDEGSKARLIERAGRRKHLPVWSAEHLSDPAHIRWFPCLRYLAAAPCVLATIGCPGPLLFPTHSLIIRGLVIPQSLCFHQNDEKKSSFNHPGAHSDQFIKLTIQSFAWPLTSVLTTQTRQPWRLLSFSSLFLYLGSVKTRRLIN